MTLTDGTPVNFSSCHNCEHRVWADDAGRLDFADVLTRATKRKVQPAHGTERLATSRATGST